MDFVVCFTRLSAYQAIHAVHKARSTVPRCPQTAHDSIVTHEGILKEKKKKKLILNIALAKSIQNAEDIFKPYEMFIYSDY